MKICSLLALFALLLTARITDTIAAPAPTATAPLEVFPNIITLESSRDTQSLVVRLTDKQGISYDVTSEAEITVADPSLAKVESGTVKPISDGATKIKIKHKTNTIEIPLTIKEAKIDRPISFKLDVMPVFLNSGCNTGACHGAARGKDGFRLSLFGYDPDGDYIRLTREQTTRRINLAIPEDSLMLTKGTGSVAHTGGTRFKEGSNNYKTLMRWLEAGAPSDPDTVAKPLSLELYPQQMVIQEGAPHRLVARAKYSDGTDRDVTNLCLFLTSNDNSAAVTPTGQITAGKRGEAFVMARFATFTVGSQVIVIPKNVNSGFPSVRENNYIDTLVNNKLKKLRITPSELCTDDIFMRRAYIDIIGMVPTREELEKFMASKDARKREKLVDELLNRKEFVEMWVMKWAELLKIRSNQDRVSYKAAVQYYSWLQDKIAKNVPFDQIVQDLLSATGGTFNNPATNYYQVDTETLKLAENTAQVFMGMRIQCAQCHNHPFDRWTMTDYYGFASFFTQVQRKRGEDPRETIVTAGGGGEINHPVSGKPIPPKFLGGESPDVSGAKDRRVLLAKWLASPDNPYFARNLANIVWAHFLGRGIIEPVDDVRISNPPSNPELLDALASHFTEYKYDFKRLVKDICTSRTYQLSTRTNPTNEGDTRNFAHGMVRRIRAEVLLDTITEVTETREKFKGLPLGARAVQIADGGTTNYFLTTFGRATRDTVCSCEVKMEPNLSQALHLLNGSTVQQKVSQGGVVKRMLDEKKLPGEVIDELYLRCFSRKPTKQEYDALAPLILEDPKEIPKVLEDVFWALLNSQEFIFNH
ncbi:MAG TPA: DUF1549 and DUF1553 domain-containing protein [Tepidisphaeraceae bacterium]|jgi:hypothetical protein|nr:DUF1549 and DUF1553 domain-containing protein [Tepidisphaeraceae bacterium]